MFCLFAGVWVAVCWAHRATALFKITLDVFDLKPLSICSKVSTPKIHLNIWQSTSADSYKQKKNEVLFDVCLVFWIHNKYILHVINNIASARQLVSNEKKKNTVNQDKSKNKWATHQRHKYQDVNTHSETLTKALWGLEPRNIIMKYRCISQMLPALLSAPCVCMCVCFLMGSVRVFLWVLLVRSLSAPALIDVTGRGSERGDLPYSASDGSIELKQGNASPPHHPRSTHTHTHTSRPLLSACSVKQKKSEVHSLWQKAKTSLDAGCRLLWKLSTLQALGWAIKRVKINHSQQY